MPTLKKSIEVDVPVRVAYDQWTQFEEFPRFMDGLEAVQQLDDKRLHWRAKIAGKVEEWDAEIVEQVPDRVISWRSTSGARNQGTVRLAVPRWRYVCIALVSAAALLFQVAQTRVFSATFGYHLTYLVISVALLGVGSGATLSGLVDRRERRPSVPLLALAAGASAIAALLLETHVDPASLLAVSIVVAYAAGSLPFIFASWIVVRFLREDPAHAGRLC